MQNKTMLKIIKKISEKQLTPAECQYVSAAIELLEADQSLSPAQEKVIDNILDKLGIVPVTEEEASIPITEDQAKLAELLKEPVIGVSPEKEATNG